MPPRGCSGKSIRAKRFPTSEQERRHLDKDKQYETAISLLQDAGQGVWVINGTYLLAETVMLGLLAQGLSSSTPPTVLLALGSGFALLICLFWWASFERAYAFYNFRIHHARSLESDSGVLSDGEKLSRGEVVNVGGRQLQIPVVARWVGIQVWTRYLIAIFAVVFIATFVVTLAR